MEIKEMTNERLWKEYIVNEKQIKTLQSTQKQIKEELERRFEKGDFREDGLS